MITLDFTPEQIQQLEKESQQAGMSIKDYILSKLLTSLETSQAIDELASGAGVK